MPTKLSRRDFMRAAAGSAVGISLAGYLSPFLAEAAAAGELPPVIWLSGGACTGCAISLLNTENPGIQDVLLKVISLRYHENVSAAQGEQAIKAIYDVAQQYPGKFILVVEGSVQTKDNGNYCIIGDKDGKPLTMLQAVKDIGSQAQAILSVGTCSAFGGLPAADPNPSGSKAVSEVIKGKPIINIAGCPPHPDWIVGTIAHVLLFKEIPPLDAFGRPKMFYGSLIHDNCQRRQYFDNGIFAENFGEMGCNLELGCKGPIAHCDSTTRFWNGGVNWCVKCGGVCIACTESEFPNFPIYTRMAEMPTGPATTATVDQIGAVLGGAAVLGIAGHLAGNVMTGRIGPHKKEEQHEKEGDK
ncbi:MAG: hydrogenase small subunit [Firmicutes bacterium]|nr:hydrogenase small subunit [Bacillota bacterium]